jgi:hypothetical protein
VLDKVMDYSAGNPLFAVEAVTSLLANDKIAIVKSELRVAGGAGVETWAHLSTSKSVPSCHTQQPAHPPRPAHARPLAGWGTPAA